MPPIKVAEAAAALEERTQLLLEHADKMRAHLEAHEFELAAREAEALALYSRGAGKMAQQLTDAAAKTKND